MTQPNGIRRISKTDTYLNVAETFAHKSTCIKRKYGVVIVKDDMVVSTGYSGSPREYDNYCNTRKCLRIELGIYQGEGYGICRVVHAEQNALLNCSREQIMGTDLHLAGVDLMDNSAHRIKPCPLCAKMIIQAGIHNMTMRMGARADEYVTVPAGELT